jgi:hypothetical protein
MRHPSRKGPASTVSNPKSSSSFVTAALAAASSPAMTSARRFFDPALTPKGLRDFMKRRRTELPALLKRTL